MAARAVLSQHGNRQGLAGPVILPMAFVADHQKHVHKCSLAPCIDTYCKGSICRLDWHDMDKAAGRNDPKVATLPTPVRTKTCRLDSTKTKLSTGWTFSNSITKGSSDPFPFCHCPLIMPRQSCAVRVIAILAISSRMPRSKVLPFPPLESSSLTISN